MKSILTNCFFLTTLSLTCFTSLSAQQDKSSFTSLTTSSSTSGAGQAPVILQLTGNMRDNRVLLNWNAGNNENTDRFEIERSNDGKNFKMAALLFGTDKAGMDQYMFYEKAKAKKIFYRIKIIKKDRKAEYSPVVMIKK